MQHSALVSAVGRGQSSCWWLHGSHAKAKRQHAITRSFGTCLWPCSTRGVLQLKILRYFMNTALYAVIATARPVADNITPNKGRRMCFKKAAKSLYCFINVILG